MRLNLSILGNILLILLVIYLSWNLILVNNGWIFIDYVNLLIHEAGHLIFMPFGQFIYILSGSLFQILFPFSFLFYFYFKKDYFSSFFILFWIGDNIVNVSIYMRDAIKMTLPLLGGDNVIHDWNWLFTNMGILNQSQLIANIFLTIGVIFIAAGIFGMISITYLKMRGINLGINA